MALILAFDTATKHCAVVLSDDGRVLASRVEDGERFSHAEKLNVFIDAVMKEVEKELRALDAVAVGIGPGSYTGLRIGLSAAKGLCFALDLQLIGISTLDVLSHELRASEIELGENAMLHPMIDARRMEVFTAEQDIAGGMIGGSHPVILDDAWCVALPSAQRHVVFGDGADKAAELWSRHAHILHVPAIKPSAKGLSSCANAAFRRKDFADLAYLVPDYGKEANVAQPKKIRGQ